MPSEIANKIVDHIFADEKSKAIDATNDAISATSYDMIQQKKVEFAQQWGFNPDETGQATADELADKMTDGTDVEPETLEVDGRKPEDPPEEVTPEDPEVEQPEATTEEQPAGDEDETNS